jgi:hypothetical protein
MSPLPRILVGALFVLGCAPFASAAPQEAGCLPTTPSGGLPVASPVTLEWTASDGYRARVEVLLPAAAVPACGWPLVAWVHPLGSDRIEQLPQAIGLAGQGFAVAVYDVRGQGDFLELNDPEVHGRTLNGLREIVDLAEVIEFVAASFPADIDGERVGVTGTSQGGWHAWVAAACSDRLLPANPWREEPFPAIDAAVARGNDGSPWFGGPGKTVFTDWERQLLFEEPDGVHWQPEELALARAAFLADDPAALDAFLGAFDHRPLLPTTQVPLMAHLAHQDSVFRSRAFVQNAASLPAGGPRRFTLGSGVHGAPANLLDDADFAWQRVLFLREHLAAESPSGDPPALVAVEERWVSRVVPDASVALGSPEAVWDRRAFTQLPPAGFAFYLTGGGGLALQAPEAAFEVPLNYDPGAGFDPQSAATGALASFGFASDVRVFESPAAPLTTQLIGSPRFRGLLRSSAPSAQVSLRLSDVAPDGSAQFLCSGGATRRDLAPGAFDNWAITFDTLAHTLLQGHRLRLEVECVDRQPYPGSPSLIRELPLFEPFDLTLRSRPTGPLVLRVPVATPQAPRLVSYPPVVAPGVPEVRTGLFSSADQAGWLYVILPTFAGSGVTPLFGAEVPIASDPFTLDAQALAPSPPFVGYVGALDTVGRAGAELELGAASLDPSLAGSVLTLVGVLRSPAGEVQLTALNELFFLGP